MREYTGFLALLLGNEFVIQLILVSLFILPWKRRRKHFYWCFPLTFAAIFALSALVSIPLPLYYFVIYVLLFGAIYLNFDLRFIESLFFSLNSYCIQNIVSTVSYATYFAILISTHAVFSFYIVIASVYLVVLGVVTGYIFVKRINKFSELKFNKLMILYAEVIFLLVAVLISYYAQQAIKNDYALYFYIQVFSFLHGVAIFLINMFNVDNSALQNEKLILQILLKKDKEYYERAQMTAEKINIMHHDLKHRVAVGGIDKEELVAIDKSGREFVTGNRALDIILTEKLMRCKGNNIRLICTTDGELISFMKPYHIYSLFGNALDNAIESLITINDDNKKEITLSVTRFGGMCKILISNYFAGNLVLENGLPKTNKTSGNHGFGIKSIRDITEVYGGEMQISVDDEIFNLLVVLPLTGEGEADEKPQ